MTSFADEFRTEALVKTGEVVRRVVKGWSFCLSYGAVDPTVAADAMADANLQVQYEGQDVTDAVMDKLKTAVISEEAKRTLRGEWMLSARLYPIGRASTEADWAYLGKMAAALGAPQRVPESVQTDPNAAHYWVWKDS